MNSDEFKEALTILSIELEFLRNQIKRKDIEIDELRLQIKMPKQKKKLTFWQWITGEGL